jgi:hypothetical protein
MNIIGNRSISNEKRSSGLPLFTNVDTIAGVNATRFSLRNVSFGMPMESDLYGMPAIGFFAVVAVSTATCCIVASVLVVDDDAGRRHSHETELNRFDLNKIC